MDLQLSSYALHLGAEALKRYKEKLCRLNIHDPYVQPAAMFKSLFDDSVTKIPDVERGDIYHYLIYTTSAYTLQDLKAYKSLQAYNYFLSGWVQDVRLQLLLDNKRFLVLAKVYHSQQLSVSAVHVWLCIVDDGQIESAHCTCMAGLGEVCSHVAATLFCLEARNTDQKNQACTSQKCTWINSPMTTVEFKEISDIDFSRPETKQRCSVMGEQSKFNSGKRIRKIKPILTTAERDAFYKKLHLTGLKPAVLAHVPDYCQSFAPISVDLPEPLTKLRSLECDNLEYDQLNEKCQEAFQQIHITAEQARMLENKTKQQSSCKLWFIYRAGRITASLFRDASHANPSSPPLSLIKKICYPEENKFSSEATRWGQMKEDVARKEYVSLMESKHNNFCVSNAGLHIHPSYPHLGASPDGLISCSCCGEGAIEIKCPFSLRLESLYEEGVTLPYLESGDDDIGPKFTLKRSHQYYFQIQAQLLLTERKYCDFIVWTTRSILIERISPDESFIEFYLPNVTAFYMKCIMPEIVAKFYTKLRPIAMPDTANSICYCQQSSDDDAIIIKCNSTDCEIVFFHLKCLGYKKKPGNTWLCIGCKQKKKEH